MRKAPTASEIFRGLSNVINLMLKRQRKKSLCIEKYFKLFIVKKQPIMQESENKQTKKFWNQQNLEDKH